MDIIIGSVNTEQKRNQLEVKSFFDVPYELHFIFDSSDFLPHTIAFAFYFQTISLIP